MNLDPSADLGGLVITFFFGTWIVLGVGGFFLFYLGKDAAFKRRWFPWYVIIAGILFVGFTSTISVLEARSVGALGILVIVIPVVCLITWLSLKFTKFCDQCGSTSFDQNWFSPMNYCSRCGAALATKPKGREDDDLLE